MNTDHWITAVMSLRRARRVVFFTGAGVSAESGVPTFRDDDGFWQRFPPEQFARWSGLLSLALTQPRVLAEFVRNVVEPIARAQPNPAHRAIAAIQRRVSTQIVTQNVDGLHQAAGSDQVHEIHGSLFEIADHTTGKIVHRFERTDLAELSDILGRYAGRDASLLALLSSLRKRYPFDWRGRNRPNLVLFGDALAEPAWSQACAAVEQCDLLIAVGTSGLVYPAALLPARAVMAGAVVITIDPQPQDGYWLEGAAGEVLPKLARDALGISST